MTKRRKNKNKWIWRAGLAVLLIVLGGVGYWFLSNNSEKTDVVEGQGKEEIIEEENEGYGQAGEEETEDQEVKKEEVVQYDGEDPNVEEDLSGVITYAGVSGDKLMIRVNIDQYLEEGSCTLTLSRGGVTIYSSIARIIGGASTATCEGFDLPTAELGGGNMQININLNANGRTGVIRREINI